MKYFLVIAIVFGLLNVDAPAEAETLTEMPSCYDGLGDIWGEKESRIRMRKLDGGTINTAQDFVRMTGTRDVSLKLIEGGDFAGWDFRKIPLHQVCFMESDLKGANLVGAEGTGAGFIKSDLTGANMQSAVMPQVMFRNAKLNDVEAKGANFHSGHFDGGWFEGGVAGWNLDGATMIGFKFECGIIVPDGCPVYQGGEPISAKDANFTRAKLHSFGLSNVELAGAILDETIVGPGQISELHGVKVDGGVVLRGGKQDVSISGPELSQLITASKEWQKIAAQPAFDCDKVSNEAEHYICGQYGQSLRQADREMKVLYDLVKP